jgi:hypothetical protein
MIGEDQHSTVREVLICRAPVTDAGFVHFQGLTHLQTLVLCLCPNLTEAGFGNLAGLSQLNDLKLINYPELTGSGPSLVARLKSLAEIDLCECPLVEEPASSAQV